MNDYDMSGRIICDYGSVKSDIETILDEARAMRTEKYFVKALGDSFTQKIKGHDASIRKRLNETFSLVVIGDFKRGKSTLINALVGKAIVPTAVTPETVTINKISFSETPKAEAVLKNGKRASLEMSELKREAIEQITRQLPAQIDYIDIKDDADILRDMSIIDTPGIGDLLSAFDAQVADYLVNADALIYVISARSPLSFTEQAFLSSTVMPQSFSRVFMAVNMADTLETQENIEKVKKLTTDRVSAISGNIYVNILSALDEFCRRQNMKRPQPQLSGMLENNFLEFETALQDDIILQKDIIKSMRCVSLTRIMLNDISTRVTLVKNTLKANTEKLSAASDEFQGQNSALMLSIEKHKASLRDDIDEMRAEAKSWIYDFMSRIKGKISSIGGSTDIHDIERYFQFYLMDLIKSALLSCIQRHQKEVADKLLTSTKIIAGEVSQYAFGSIDTQIADCIKDISWTNVDSAVFVGNIFIGMSGLSSVIGPLYLVGQAVAGFVRQKAVSKKQSDFLSPILQEYGSIVNEVVDNIDGIYTQIKDSAVNKLDELYQSQVESSMEAIRQAKEILSDEDTKSDEVAAYLDDVLQSIEDYKGRLSKYD